MSKESAAENETRHERFKRIATARTRSVLEKLRILGNCSNTANYEYSEAEVRAIFKAITEVLERTELMFKKHEMKEFSLK